MYSQKQLPVQFSMSTGKVGDSISYYREGLGMVAILIMISTWTSRHNLISKCDVKRFRVYNMLYFIYCSTGLQWNHLAWGWKVSSGSVLLKMLFIRKYRFLQKCDWKKIMIRALFNLFLAQLSMRSRTNSFYFCKQSNKMILYKWENEKISMR